MSKTIAPKLPAGRTVWTTQFRHPLRENKGLKVSLATTDETAAKAICRELERLCNDKTLQTVEAARLAGFADRTLEIFFGVETPDAPSALKKWRQTIGLDEDVEFLRFGLHENNLVPSLVETLRPAFDDYPFKTSLEATVLAAVMAHHEKKKLGQLTLETDDLKKKLTVLQPELENLRAENTRLRRSQNVDVKASFGQVVKAWKAIYKVGHDETTIQQAFYAIDTLADSLPHQGNTNIGRVTVKDLDKWLRELKKKTGGDLSPITRRKYKAYTGPFWKFAVKNYGLAENPILQMDKMAGLSRRGLTIEAIRNLDDLNALLNALKPAPYWRAWVATACLLGPRWAEITHIRLQDVTLPKGDGHAAVRIANTDDHTTKTGGERDVVIERSILLPILREYLRDVRPTLKTETAWLFPSTHHMETDNGAWTHWTFHHELTVQMEQAQGRAKKVDRTEDYWKFTSKEFRHTAGTLLFLNGWAAFQIARHLGNSTAICERYYCSGTFSGRPIGLVF